MSDEPTTVTGAVPDGVLEAFRAYETALMDNDLDALDAFFAPGPETVRGDAAGLLVGHDRISAFRGVRGGVAARTIVETHVRVIDDASVLIVSVSAFAAGGRGLQTQLWRRMDDGWVIQAAHVTGAAPAITRSVWRVAGAPLLPPTSEGPLSGMTVAVKDLYDIAGFAVGAGIPEFLAEASPATADADAVAALRGAGAAVQGIAQTDEFAYSIAGRNVHYGIAPNPAVPGAIPGGSSSGPAAAVALGQASIGLATDTAGSIRVPASYQGLWGLRTTHGAVSARGLLPLAPSFDAVGWLTRSADVLRAAAAATLDARVQHPFSAVRLALAPGTLEGVSGEVADAFAARVADIRSLGVTAEPEEVDLGDLDAAFAAFRTVQAAEAWRQHGDWVTGHPGVLGPDIAERFEIASRVSEREEADGRSLLAETRTRFDAVLDGRVLLLPSTPSTAPSIVAPADEIASVRAATLRMTAVAGVGGYPALSIPLMSVGGAPLGLCLVGPRYTDLALIDLAAGWADALPKHD